MKALLPPPFRMALPWFCAVLLMAGAHSAKGYITDCAKPIMLGEVKFKEATLEEAVAYIKLAVKKLGTFDESYLNVVIVGASEEQKKKKISLEAREISLQSAMEHIARSAGLKVRVDAHAIVLAPPEQSDKLSTRTYRVPPDFISTGSAVK
jgi:hypothetical protein